MSNTRAFKVGAASFQQDEDNASLAFFGVPSVVFQVSSSLYYMLRPLADICGVEMYRLLVAHGSSDRSEDLYRAMVMHYGENFQDGFLAWGAAVEIIGWGKFEFLSLDHDRKQARLTITNPWELMISQHEEERWGCPFLQGKLIGVFTHAFGTSCWADEENLVMTPAEQSVEFSIYAAEKTLAQEIERLRRHERDARERRLEASVDDATHELHEQLHVADRQRDVIRQLSIPILQVWEGVIVVPLIGALDAARARALTEELLTAVSARGARHVILDLTGVAEFDASAATHLQTTIAAARLLGARCMLTGLSPASATRLLTLATTGALAYPTVQAALQRILR
jgi:rsbT co-antagonist protein RsbR